MKYRVHSFRNAMVLFENDAKYKHLWEDIVSVIEGIKDTDIKDKFNTSCRENQKSISDAINTLIDERLTVLGWERQSPIFNESEYRPNGQGHWWTLDFSKEEISMEVAFNHGEATAWNLIKPVLASELNHVEKAIQTSAGVVITATDELKNKGNFDGATGSYEKFLQYLRPMQNMLTVPMVIVGLEAPDTFFVNPDTKEILDIVCYVIPKNIVLAQIKKRLLAYHIAFQSTGINRKKVKIPMSVRVQNAKVAVMSHENASIYIDILEEEGWHVFVYDKVNSKDDMDQMCEEILSVSKIV